MESVLENILRESLNLNSEFKLQESTELLGVVPELDSMAVVVILTQLEERLGVEFDDDELDASVFTTYGSLRDFVSAKAQS